MWTRRRFLQASAATAAAATVAPPVEAGMPPLDQSLFPPLDRQGDQPWLGLATSLLEEHDGVPEVEGRLPAALRGHLYRNGPGRFDRGGARKRCVLDGDGMVQHYAFDPDAPGGVRYRNRYVRTAKWLEEEERGAYRYATWTTQAPGGIFANMFARRMANQAGVSVWPRGDALYAFDESAEAHELDPGTLATRGPSDLGAGEGRAVFAAHPKRCARTGEWLHFGLEYGRELSVHLHCFAADGRPLWHREHVLPRYVYVHDWFVSERHLVLLLHPAEIAMAGFLLGRRSLAGSFRWRPEKGNVVLVFPRAATGEPVRIETEAAWMWHSLNAFDDGAELVCDFVGDDDPADFIGDDPALWALMEGRRGRSSRGSTLRRYRIDPAAGTLRSDTLADGGSYEFPVVAPARSCRPHRYGYLAHGVSDDPFWSRIVRVDTRTGGVEAFAFGERQWCGEPVFAPHPEAAGQGDERGWLLTQVYDGDRRRSFLAILDAARLADGPVARVHHAHHVPLSFHGQWRPA